MTLCVTGTPTSEISLDNLATLDGVPNVSTLAVTEKGHGRIEERGYVISEDLSSLPGASEWSGLRSVAMVISRRIQGEKVSEE